MPAAAAPTTWTIKALLAWTANYLKEKGIESPRLEAELLLAHAMKCKRIDLIVRFDEEPDELSKTTFRDLVKRRAEHWPTAYLIGEREFFLLKFEVSPAVLIPRPETESLVLAALDELKDKPNPHILELGAGSGCIAISIAHKLQSSNIMAVDLSPDAIQVATANAKKHNVSHRIEFRVGDLYAPLKEERFDAIISNPPYISSSEMATLQEEVRDHEPRHALDGGPDGLAFYRRIAADAARFLNPGGVVMVEVGYQQAEAVSQIFSSSPGLKFEKVIKDAAGIARVVTARKA